MKHRFSVDLAATTSVNMVYRRRRVKERGRRWKRMGRGGRRRVKVAGAASCAHALYPYATPILPPNTAPPLTHLIAN